MSPHHFFSATLRAKIAAAVLVLIGLLSTYQPLIASRLRVSPDNEVLVVLDRARCLSSVLPKGVQRYGSLNIRPEDGKDNQERRLYLLRYLLAPDRVSDSPDMPWVIGYYSDQPSGLADLPGHGLSLVKDCANGVFLLKR